MNQATFGFIFQCLLQQEAHGLDSNEGGWKKIVGSLIGVFILVAYIGLLNYACWLARFNQNHLRAVATIGEHIVAWSCIEVFGNMRVSRSLYLGWQEMVNERPDCGSLKNTPAQYGSFVVIAFFASAILCSLTSYVR